MMDSPNESIMNLVEDIVSSEPLTARNNLLPIHGNPNSSCSHGVDNILSTISDNGFQGNFSGSSFTASVAPAQTFGVRSPESERLLANHFQRPDQHHLWSALRCILLSDWYNRGVPEPEMTHGRSTYHQFLEPFAGGTGYACLFDRCVYKVDRQDRALAHIRTHIHHRPYVCGGQCEKTDW
jgi:hypothetical protein